jgi:hypothetical protein
MPPGAASQGSEEEEREWRFSRIRAHRQLDEEKMAVGNANLPWLWQRVQRTRIELLKKRARRTTRPRQAFAEVLREMKYWHETIERVNSKVKTEGSCTVICSRTMFR